LHNRVRDFFRYQKIDRVVRFELQAIAHARLLRKHPHGSERKRNAPGLAETLAIRAGPGRWELNQKRHSRECRICKHPHREEIERQLIDWEQPARVARKFHLSRAGLYRHMDAIGLFVQRDRNIKAALARILEKAGRVRVTAASVVAAVTVYGKLNSAGRFVNRRETVDLNALFDRMSRDELETYAVSGTLPDWFKRTVSLGGQFAQHKIASP
jgi:hypothetical protein